MKNTIRFYQTLLTCEQFVVTGSTALSFMGLRDKKDVSDLDLILVNPTEETKHILEKLQNEYAANTKPSSGEVSYIFLHEETKIDVFIVDKKVDTELKVDDFYISKISTIIAAKKRFSRMKDWLQLRKMAACFFKQEEFEKYLDNK